MTDDNTTDDDESGTVPGDLGDMDVSQVSFNSYLVTNWGGDDPTGYMVDLSAPSCECPDFEYNREDGQVCKHLLKANLVADTIKSAEQEATRRVAEEVRHLRNAAESLEQTATARQADAGAAEAEASGGSSSEAEADPTDGDWTSVADDSTPDAVVEVLTQDFEDRGDFRWREIDDGYEVEPIFKSISDDDLDTWDDVTGPEGKDAWSPIWPEDYEDGDPPDGTKIDADTADMIANLVA